MYVIESFPGLFFRYALRVRRFSCRMATIALLVHKRFIAYSVFLARHLESTHGKIADRIGHSDSQF